MQPDFSCCFIWRGMRDKLNQVISLDWTASCHWNLPVIVYSPINHVTSRSNHLRCNPTAFALIQQNTIQMISFRQFVAWVIAVRVIMVLQTLGDTETNDQCWLCSKMTTWWNEMSRKPCLPIVTFQGKKSTKKLPIYRYYRYVLPIIIY